MSQHKMDLGQFFTPLWAAEAIVDRHFSDLSANDFVIEPSCGQGAFLKALPAHVNAIGVEIDPEVAAIARQETDRRILVGDFRDIALDIQPTLIIGNPPFKLDVIDGFFDRSQALLPEGGKLAMLLPAYALQTADRVTRYSEHWSMLTEMIPRNIFPGLSKPLVFTIFTKDRERKFFGMALYLETSDAHGLAKAYRDALTATTGSIWETVCKIAIQRLGGQADLKAIYSEIESNRPSKTKFWREKIRQTLRVYSNTFTAQGDGLYALAA